MNSIFLSKIPQYFFARDKFVETFQKVFSSEEIFNLEVACQEHKYFDDFILYYAEDEFYIIHISSGTIISWYKHLGRANVCNKSLDISDLFDFLHLLKISLKEENVI